MSRILIVANDHVGTSMAGPGIRYVWFARELARRGHEVTLVVPFETDLEPDGFELRVDNPWHAPRMEALARRYDAVVAQRLPPTAMVKLAASPTRAIYDLYAPWTIEYAALTTREPKARPAVEARLNELAQRTSLETGDAFVCASERQRDLWLGALMTAGRLTPEAYARDSTFRSLLDVVPFGIDPEPPRRVRPVLKGVVPGIAETDRLILWNGGVWNWFDPLTVIRAVVRLDRPDVKLYFLGTKHPNPGVPEMEMTRRAFALADELGVRDRSVFFNDGWIPYDERGAYLVEADVGVSAHFDELETRFAFRTRLLDCFWAGLPVVTTEGDTLADLVRDRDLGRVVGVQDVDAWVDALRALLDDARSRERIEASLTEVRRELAWPRVVEPMARLVEDASAVSPRARSLARAVNYAALRVQLAYMTRGPWGLAKRLTLGIVWRARRDRSARPSLPSER